MIMFNSETVKSKYCIMTNSSVILMVAPAAAMH